ncbi:MAG TPA: hypothetical protein VF403_20470 [Kofleriaceae bacterium]
MTADVDAVVLGDAIDVDSLVEVLSRHAIAPRSPDAAAFARVNLVLLLHHVPSQVELDVSFGWTAFEREALAARTVIPYGTVEAPMATPEDLLIMKAIAGRPVDVKDGVQLLLLYPSIDLVRVRRTIAELAIAADAPELTDGLDEILKHVPRRKTQRTPKKPSTRPKKKRRRQ